MSNFHTEPDGFLLDEARAFAEQVRHKIEHRQGGVPTFADHVWLAFIAHLDRGGEIGDVEREALACLAGVIAGRHAGRFVDYADRMHETGGRYGSTDVEYMHMVTSQGRTDCLEWKGLPLFKTVYDVSLYPMILWALRPRSIIELGSGSGASALWLADTASVLGLATHVYSVDLHAPAWRDDRITFIEGDCEAMPGVFDENVLRAAPHPWLVIEDAHVDVGGVFAFFHGHTQPGDYVIVEDSDGKRAELQRFFLHNPGSYKVDTYFTDFFGRNATCAQDSIFVRLPPTNIESLSTGTP